MVYGSVLTKNTFYDKRKVIVGRVCGKLWVDSQKDPLSPGCVCPTGLEDLRDACHSQMSGFIPKVMSATGAALTCTRMKQTLPTITYIPFLQANRPQDVFFIFSTDFLDKIPKSFIIKIYVAGGFETCVLANTFSLWLCTFYTEGLRKCTTRNLPPALYIFSLYKGVFLYPKFYSSKPYSKTLLR